MKCRRQLAWLGAIALTFSGCFFGGKKGEVVTPDGAAEPDKILYEKGLQDVTKGRYDVGRLVFQNLLITYPDSEYQERAKLAIADSFYKQGGTSGLLQAKAEYEDFKTFFPTSEEIDDAQMRIALTHYRQMHKPNRDATHARAAEEEFKAFVREHPESPLVEEAQQYLREVQEVLAQGDMGVAKHEFVRRNYKGAFARAATAIRSYPDFSGQDEALYVLGRVSERQQNIVAAGYYYGLVARYHPLSEFEGESRKKLEKLGLPIPDVDPVALARAQAELEDQIKRSLMGRFAKLFTKRPDVSRARKANRQPLVLGPEQINLEPGGPKEIKPLPAAPVAVPTRSVGVKIVSRSDRKVEGESETSDSTPEKEVGDSPR
jgi:outer membrane protein assembly factor BamD